MYLASGVRAHAFAALLFHEPASRGDLAIHARCLRLGIPDDMDCGTVLTVRMGGTKTLY